MDKIISFTAIFSGFQWLSILLAIITYKKYKNTQEKVFLYFLIFSVVITDFGALLLIYFDINSTFIFNIYSLVAISINHYWFYKIIPSKRKLILISEIIFVIVFLFMFLKGGFLTTVWHQPVIIGSIAVFVFTMFYFVQLLIEDKVVVIYNSQRFWIATGLLIFNLGIAPTLFFQDQLDTFGIAYNSIITLLNIILYGSFIISFLCLYKK